MRYQAFHSGSSDGIGRGRLHFHESLSLPFLLPDQELARPNACEIIEQVARTFKGLEHASDRNFGLKLKTAWTEVQPLVEEYFSVTDSERILIEDTLSLNRPSIHHANPDLEIPSLAFPDRYDRTRYADTLCDTLKRLTRKQGIAVHAEGVASKHLNLVLLTIIFGDAYKPYTEVNPGEAGLWRALSRVSQAARNDAGPFSYLRGFSYFESDRLHMLKPGTMRNWCRTAALNDADAIFEHLVRRDG